jgi:hypothetical protein
VNPVSQPSAKLPLAKPKPKPAQQSELERRIIEMGFPVLKVQLAMRRNPSLTDADNERHLSGLMEAALSLDGDDVELRALEEEQMAAAIQNTASAASEAAAGDTLTEPVPSAADPIMMKFFGLSAALRYCLSSQGLWDKAGRGDVGMVHAVLASVSSLLRSDDVKEDGGNVLESLHLLLNYRELIASTRKLIVPSTQTQTFESEHPYSHNLDVSFNVSFPGASSIGIVFDHKCRTESSHDYLRF